MSGPPALVISPALILKHLVACQLFACPLLALIGGDHCLQPIGSFLITQNSQATLRLNSEPLFLGLIPL